MTAFLSYTITCNGCGTVQRTDHDRVHSARAETNENGWSHRIRQTKSGPNPSLDFCPACEPPKADDKNYVAPKVWTVTSQRTAIKNAVNEAYARGTRDALFRFRDEVTSAGDADLGKACKEAVAALAKHTMAADAPSS